MGKAPGGMRDFERVEFKEREAWRAWLAANHARSPGVWLIYSKKATGTSRLAYAEAVEEALCYGWIDSRPNALDEERAMQLFTPRKPGSPWSRVNKERIARLIETGAMAAPGQAKIDAAQRDGSWAAYDAIEDLIVPADLAAALAADPAAEAGYAAFGVSTKKQLLWWIASAKRPETRAKRVAETTAGAAESRNPIAYVPKDKR